MRLISPFTTIFPALLLLTTPAIAILPDVESVSSQRTLASPSSVSPALFSSLERLSRLIDTTYCLATTGISPPFSCASRCRDFPDLELLSTFTTGPLMGDSCGFIAVDHNPSAPAIVVAFRGSYTPPNFIVDLSTVPQEYVPYPEPDDGQHGGKDNNKNDGDEIRCANCTVHMGFFQSWRHARRLVLPVLESARAHYPNHRVQLIGHSLGGAVACLAALDFRVGLGWGDAVEVTTFGEPMVGNEGFAAYVNRAFGLAGGKRDDYGVKSGEAEVKVKGVYRRVTHVGDPVPLLPLTEWGYRPHAGEVFIGKADLPPSPEDLRLCRGDADPECSSSSSSSNGNGGGGSLLSVPSRLRLWEIFLAHRDYFWRLGICLPGGDPSNWGRPPYNVSMVDEL